MTEVTIELVATTCAACGVIFGISREYNDNLRDTGQGFFCPNGHSLTLGSRTQKKIEQLKNKVAQEQEAAEYWRKSYHGEREDHDQTKRRLSATKKRVANGVCPCCQRSFKQLSQHMKSKHPDYVSEAND